MPNKTPRVIFRRSMIYDRNLEPLRKFPKPEENDIKDKYEKLQKLWLIDGEKVLEELSLVTGLQWQQNEIICYVTWGLIPFSDPLTISASGKFSAEKMEQTLIHELIHCLIALNVEANSVFKEKWEKLFDDYSEHSQIVIIHIAVHTLHGHILQKYFTTDLLQQEMDWVKNPDYVLAWKIVQEVGFDKIIDKYLKV